MIAKEKKQEIIAKYGRTANDTGSPEVQVALLTARITELTDHLIMVMMDMTECLKDSVSAQKSLRRISNINICKYILYRLFAVVHLHDL